MVTHTGLSVKLEIDHPKAVINLMPPLMPPRGVLNMVARLSIYNPSLETITLHFPTTQKCEWTLLKGGTTEIWRWSSGRHFQELAVALGIHADAYQTYTMPIRIPHDSPAFPGPGNHLLVAEVPATDLRAEAPFSIELVF